jgi:lysophospholipase L1-like esterase
MSHPLPFLRRRRRVSAAAEPEVAPPPSTNLLARFLANTGITSAGSPTRISAWADQSGNGNNASQATGANQPYVGSDLLGRPTVRFVGGASTFMDLPGGTTALARAVSIWVVGRLQTHGSQSYVSLNAYAGNAGGLRTVLSTSAPPIIYAFGRSSVTVRPKFNPGFWAMISGASAAQVHSNLLAVTGLTAVTADATPRTLVLGRSHTAGSYGSFEAYEILIYDAAQSDADRDAVKAYIAAAYPDLATSYTKQVVFEGDSISAGSGLPDTELSYPQQVYRTGLSDWRYSSQALSGATVATMTTRAASVDAQIEAGYSRNVLMVLIGRNDVTEADNSATVYSDLVTYVQARVTAGWEVWVGTCIATGSSLQGTIDALNAKIRGTPLGGTGNGIFADAGADRIVDYGAMPEFDTSADSSNTTYYQGDNTHPTAAGCTKMADVFATELAIP